MLLIGEAVGVPRSGRILDANGTCLYGISSFFTFPALLTVGIDGIGSSGFLMSFSIAYLLVI